MEGIDKRCQRCEADFKCNANDIANCQCQPVSISEETAAFLQKTTYGCLCAKCLSELDGLVEMATKTAFPKDVVDFVGDLHFYQEGRKIVFT